MLAVTIAVSILSRRLYGSKQDDTNDLKEDSE